MTAPDALPPRYRDVTPLGRGAFGAVYRATDERGREVAIKVLAEDRALDSASAWQFQGEYRRLARLAHPAFPAALDEGRTPDGLPYYAMALAPGAEPQAPMPAPAVRRFLTAATDALGYLHGVGWVHGDLKPDNVRLDATGRLTLLDVGLMAPVGALSADAAGTLTHMAPEVLRLAPVSGARDVYALAVTAYALWHGRAPFEGSPAELVRAHLSAPVPPGPRADDDPALDALLRAMLAKDPADRPTARAAWATLTGAPAPAAERSLRAGDLVGRDEEIAAFDAALAEGRGWCAFEAPFGGGKTRLLDELRPRARQAGYHWVGAASAGAADAPAAPLRAAVAQALRLADAAPDPTVEAWLGGRVPPDAAELEPAARLVVVGRAVVSALSGAAQATGGLVVALDDWHLADGATRDLVGLLHRAATDAPIVWLLAGEPTEAPWPVTPRALAPFDAAAQRDRLASRLGENPPESLLTDLAGAHGNPLLVDLLLERHVATGALSHHDGAWRFAPDAAAAEPAASPLALIVGPRLDALDAEARRLAGWLAIAAPAGELAAGLLAERAVVDPSAIDRVVASGLAIAASGRVRLASPAYAALLLPPDATEVADGRAALARSLAGDAAPSALPPETVLKATRLAMASGDAALTWLLAGEAGRRALEAASARDALAFLAAALDAQPADAPNAERLGVVLPLAEAERLSDRLADAAPHYESAIALAEATGDPRAAARAWIGLAKCRQLQGDYPAALAGLERATAAAEAAGDGAQAARALATEGRLLAYRGESARAMACCERAAAMANDAGAPALESQALTMLGYLVVHEDLNRGHEALAILDRAIELSERAGDRLGRGLALDNLGNAHLALGDLTGARDAFDRYAENCAEIGALTEAIAARLNQAIVAAERGDTERGLAFGRDVGHRADAAGRKFLKGAALAAVGQALWRSGQLADALAPFDEALAIAASIQNRLLEEHVRAYRLEALIATGALDAAQAEAEAFSALNAASQNAEMADRLTGLSAELAALQGDHAESLALVSRLLGSPNRLAAHGAHRLAARLAMAVGDDARPHAEAALAIARAWEAPWHVLADQALLAAAVGALGDDALAAAIAREVLAAPPLHPFALAEAALVAGGPATALAPARSALAALAPHQREAALAAWHLTGLDAAPTPGSLSATGHGAVSPIAFAERLERLAAASDEAALSRAALEGVMALVGAERGYLIAYEDGRLRQAVTSNLDYEAESADGFSGSIVERVLFTQAPLYLTDAGADAEFQGSASVMALALKTVVCLPLATPERILGVLYADRRSVDPVLTDADLALLLAYATTAAGAIVRERARAELELGHAVASGLGAGLARRLPVDAARQELLAAAIATVGAERGFWLTPGPTGHQPAIGLDAHDRAIGATDVSRGVIDAVAESGEPVGLLDLSAAEGFAGRQSVQALGLRTVWCLRAHDAEGSLLYLDTTAMPDTDPAYALRGLETLIRFAAPLLSP